MAGHTAIVTGANHGIGAATAMALARRGCAVLCTFLRLDAAEEQLGAVDILVNNATGWLAEARTGDASSG